MLLFFQYSELICELFLQQWSMTGSIEMTASLKLFGTEGLMFIPLEDNEWSLIHEYQYS
jgi:hypothetical protein